MPRRYKPEFNPIASVDGYAIPAPATCDWALQDLSDEDSGRTEDNEMHKNRIGQVIKLTLAWNYIDDTDAADVLRAFQPEYFTVKYYDTIQGEYVEREFYRGDITAKQHSRKRGVWKKISFDIISRYGDVISV